MIKIESLSMDIDFWKQLNKNHVLINSTWPLLCPSCTINNFIMARVLCIFRNVIVTIWIKTLANSINNKEIYEIKCKWQMILKGAFRNIHFFLKTKYDWGWIISTFPMTEKWDLSIKCFLSYLGRFQYALKRSNQENSRLSFYFTLPCSLTKYYLLSIFTSSLVNPF